MMELRALVRVAAYPTLVLAGLLILTGLLDAGAALGWAPFATLAMVGALVLVLERFIPFRARWHAHHRDYLEDGMFMVAVQVAVPLTLLWALTLGLSTTLSHRPNPLAIWPNHWPILAQLVLKVVAGDFLRYWLHRGAHSWTPLWRLHEVHHHPEKLYSTNVFRFHPAEKALQFCCDTLPFMLMGIGPTTLAYYFVFYAISGLLQHSNADIRLGPLNYVFSGPEVHRWHHSRAVSESNHNYAHSFVVWDLVFGSYFRPQTHVVEALGLLDPDYPHGFWRQVFAPLRRTAHRPS
jgi:ornithine lipid hydroxylase